MTMKTKLLICLGALLGVAAVDVVKNKVEMPHAKLTVKVMDEQGAPMPGAVVTLTFMDPATRNGVPVEGSTNTEGMYSGEGQTDGAMGGMVNKEGYYRGGFSFTGFTGLENGRWQPWDAIYTTNLRPILNPVAMYAKRVQADLPVLDQLCGYDLEKGDWVTPYGKGNKPDFTFKGHREFKNRNDFDVRVELTFANPADGLIKAELPAVGKYSTFKWEREAPEAEYPQGVHLRNAANANEVIHSYARTDAFFFRVRTIAQNGRIIAANYGKISGGLRLDGMNSKTCTVLFTYYLNPTSLDRNMEWDPKRNLLTGLSWEENPREP
jgi:hypothetical protein